MAVTSATAAYLHAEDSFAQWLDECRERKDFALETTDELCVSFKAWLEKAGEEPPSSMFTARVLKEAGPEEIWARNRNLVHNLAPANYSALCAATLPVGLDRLGMPVGLGNLVVLSQK